MWKLIRKNLKSFLSLFKPYKSNKEIEIPETIENKEKIVRSIFSPMNVNKNEELRTNVFKSPGEIDEVSVNRLDFTTPDFCKNISKKIQNPATDRTYFGLALLIAMEIREVKADVKYSPIIKESDFTNPYHSDIVVGYVKQKGEQFPAEINYKITQLTKKARFYKDPNPENNTWNGETLE